MVGRTRDHRDGPTAGGGRRSGLLDTCNPRWQLPTRQCSVGGVCEFNT